MNNGYCIRCFKYIKLIRALSSEINYIYCYKCPECDLITHGDIADALHSNLSFIASFLLWENQIKKQNDKVVIVKPTLHIYIKKGHCKYEENCRNYNPQKINGECLDTQCPDNDYDNYDDRSIGDPEELILPSLHM